MKLPYGYVLVDDEIVIHEEKADVVRAIFKCYKISLVFEKGVSVVGIDEDYITTSKNNLPHINNFLRTILE